MAVTKVNSTGLDVNAILSTSSTANGKKATEQVSDFSSILDSTTQNSKSGQDAMASNATPVATETKSDTEFAVDEPVKEEAKMADTDTEAEEKAQVVEAPEEETDETVIEAVSTALNYIIDQIKEVLGVEEEEITATMEDLGLSQGDLLDSTNLTQLVTALSGEESVISLVADEDLYSKLQDLTNVVDTELETVLEDTGLSLEELQAVVETLHSSEEEPAIQEVPETVSEELIGDNEEGIQKQEPVVVIEDNTKSITTKPATTYDKLPENQQKTAETTLNMQSESSAKSGRSEQDNQQSKDYSQNQGVGQTQQTIVNDKVAEVATDETISYTTAETTENIMRQLADSVKLIKDENMTQMELQLHPSSLGTVNVSLISKGGAVTAQFTTQNEQVRAAIESQAAQLQADIEKQGVKVEAIEVTVESHEMEKNLDENNQRREKEGEQTEESIKATRRANINLRTLGEDGGDLLEEIQGADDATRITMEMMSAHGNTLNIQA
jgi:flagellar hook-length control protein FliK